MPRWAYHRLGLEKDRWKQLYATWKGIILLHQDMLQAYPEGAIAYYNSAAEAGASQPRKHLQLLPASLEGKPTAPLPFGCVIKAASKESGAAYMEAVSLRQLPFQSFGTTLPPRYAKCFHDAVRFLFLGKLWASFGQLA